MVDIPSLQIFLINLIGWSFLFINYRLLFGVGQSKAILFLDVVATLSVCFLADVSFLLGIALVFGYFIALGLREGRNQLVAEMIILIFLLSLQLIFMDGLGLLLNSVGAFRLVRTTSFWIILPYLGVTFATAIICLAVKTRIMEFVAKVTTSFQVERTLLLLSAIAYCGQLFITVVAQILEAEATYALSLVVIFAWMDLLLITAIVSLIHSYDRELKTRISQSVSQEQVRLAQENNDRFQALHRERHDLKNMIISVQGYLQNQQIEPATSC